MNESDVITKLQGIVKAEVEVLLTGQKVVEVTSGDWMEALARRVIEPLAEGGFEAWNDTLEMVAREMALPCPCCNRPRKCKRLAGKEMIVQLMGLKLKVPKLYLECGHCNAHGVSITKLLTGLRSGDSSAEMKLLAGYCGAENSYGKASRDLKVHHGQEVERTSVRSMSLEVEEEAKKFAEQERVEGLGLLESEAHTEGVEHLMVQADGGSVRTGTLVECEPGDEGYGKKTPRTEKPKRKRITRKREVITIDVRRPGQCDPDALDVMVPVVSAQGERSRRMLASAARAGLGDETHVAGLGDLGSNLPDAFDEAFVGYDSIYSGDWKHVCDHVDSAGAVLEGFDLKQWKEQMCEALRSSDNDRLDNLLRQAKPVTSLVSQDQSLSDVLVELLVGYDWVISDDWGKVHDQVETAAAVLEDLDVEQWKKQMRDAIWNRDEHRRDELLEQAAQHRVAVLPESLSRCPVHALTNYVTHNWHRMNAAMLKGMDLDYVSARAEAQVRDRTRGRFGVAGVWLVENIEGKATLRAIIAEGSWQRFRLWYLARNQTLFQRKLRERLEQAVAQNRLSAKQVETMLEAPAVARCQDAA
jgi:hypothetical protein